MLRKRRTHQILELILNLLPHGSILDVGTCNGELAHRLMAGGYDVCAFDIDPSRCGYPEVEVTRADIMSGLPYGDKSFHVLTALEVIEHMEDPFKAVREFHRVLRADGLLVLSTPNYGNIEKRLFYLYAGTLPTAPQYDPSAPAAGRAHHHVSPMTLPRLKYLLETNGFEILHLTTANPKRNSRLLFPLVAFVWLFLHAAWSPRKRERYHIKDQMKVILGGRSLVVVSRRSDRSPPVGTSSSGRKGP